MLLVMAFFCADGTASIANRFSLVLVWYRLFLNTIQVTVTTISKFLIPVGYEYLMVFLFSKSFGSIHHARAFIPTLNCPGYNMV